MFEQVQNKFEPINKEFKYVLLKKLARSLQKNKLGSRIRKKPVLGTPGFRIQGSKKHRIPDPQYGLEELKLCLKQMTSPIRGF
jgi:hypothetical protein